MTLLEFETYALNKKQIEYHSYNPNAKYQCVDLANAYIDLVWGLTPIIGTDAKDFPERLTPGIEFVKNTTEYLPEPGEIAVWNGKVGGGAGHIAIVLKKGLQTRFLSLDQNWSKPLFITEETHPYTNVRGFIRKVKSTQESMPEDTIPVKKTDFENLVSKATKLDELEIRGITEDYFTQLKRDLEGEREAFKAYKTDSETFIDKVASLLGSTADKEGIIKFATNLGNSLNEAGEWKTKYEKEMQARKADALEYSEKLITLDERIVKLQADHQQEIDQMIHEHSEEIELIRQEIADALTKKEVAEAALKQATRFAGFWKFITRLGVK